MRAAPLSFKVVLLGEGRVGKTSVAVRYVQGAFADSQQPTLQAAFLSKRVAVEGRAVQLSIWDTAGQERFHALGPIYYRDADAALLVYDVTDADTLERVKSWVRELRKMAPPDIALCIAANKVDLDRNRRISLDEARRYAESIGAGFFTTSAKQNLGIEEVFLDIARRLVEKRKAASPPDSVPLGGSKKSLVIVDHLPQPPPPKSSCCF